MEQNETNTAPTTESQQPAHLLDTQAQPEAPVSTIPDNPSTVPNQGERPNWLPEKFKTPEDLAKSYGELEKRMTTKVPEKYDWAFTKDFGLQDMTPEIDTEVTTAFRKAGYTQDQVKTAMSLYADQMGRIEQQLKSLPVSDLQAEEQSLRSVWGTDYATRLDAVRKYSTTLPQSMLNKPLIDTAEGIQFLETLMEGNRMPNPISNTQAAPVKDLNSVRENIREMRADNKMQLPPGDPVGETHRQRLYNLYEQLDRLEKQGR